MKKTMALTLLGVLLMAFGCSNQAEKPASTEKTVLTMANYSETNFREVELLIEDQYPDIDLVPEFILGDIYTSEVERRLRKGEATDLIILSQPSVHYMQKYMLDLSGYAFCAQYEKSIMENLTNAGKAYVVPLTGHYHGYLYNKTLFAEHNIAQPTGNQELEQAIKALTAAGIDNGYGTAFGIKFSAMSALGSFTIGYGVPDFLSTVKGIQWAEEFSNKEATFEGTWEPIFDQLLALTEKGIINPEMLDRQRNNVHVLSDMATGKSAVAFYPELTLERLKAANKAAFQDGTAPALYDYGMLPFFSSQGRPAWTISTPDCYIGFNADLRNQENSAKLDACVRILDLLSTQKGQEAIAQGMHGSISYLRGCSLGEDNVPDGLTQVVEDGYIYTGKFPGKTRDVLGRSFCDLMLGKLSPKECAKAIDQYYYMGDDEAEYAFMVLGNMEKDALIKEFNVCLGESELGNLVADSIRELSGAQIAVANGGGIRSGLYAGEVTGADLLAACPYDHKIVVLEVSGQVIRQMLENGLSTLILPTGTPDGRFLQISGASYTFDSTRPTGQRLLSVTFADGTPLDNNARYTVAVNDYMAGAKGYDAQGNGDGYLMLNVYDENTAKSPEVILVKETGKTYREAMEAYFNAHSDKPVTAGLEGRIINVAN